MLKTTFFFFIFWLGLLLSLVLLLGYYFLRIFHFRKAEKSFVHFITSRWSRFTLFTAGIKLKIYGRENIPVPHSGFVVISNHQGSFDIPVFMGSMPFSAGFISKEELMKLPFLSSWMRALNCLPIDRKNPRESRGRLIERIKSTDKNPMFLFPEGTRSRGPAMGPFRTGTLKLLFLNRISVLPVTINGSYKCFEKYENIKPGEIDVYFHPVLDTSGYGLGEFDKFNSNLQKIIASPLGKGI